MRITSWAIVFVMIIFSFSFANRMLVNNKMEIVKEEVKYNNAIDLATMDATRDMMENMINLGTGNRESFYSVLSSVDTFFESFGLFNTTSAITASFKLIFAFFFFVFSGSPEPNIEEKILEFLKSEK